MRRNAPLRTGIVHTLLVGLTSAITARPTAALEGPPRGDIVVPADLAHHREAIDVDSGVVVHPGGPRGVIWETAVHVPDALWLRLTFDQLDLGQAPPGGEPTIVRLVAAADGSIQTMNAAHVLQWQHSSAYFNGGLVIVQIVSDPGAEPSRAKMTEVIVGDPDWGVETICGPTDDRVLSEDPRAARALAGSLCTAWLIDGVNNGGNPGCLLSAGHCVPAAVTGGGVIEFNVPPSNPDGSINHPGAEDQYVVDGSSIQSNAGGIGKDWAYFGCFPNSNTGLTAFQAQGDAHTLADTAPSVDGQSITVTGFGSASGVMHFSQKTHTGPYFSNSGLPATYVRYETDTTGGNSGSPVEVATGVGAGTAIGIHTHGGCNSTGGANHGTSVDNPNFQSALNWPQGICWPCFGIDSDGDSAITVADLLAMLGSWGSCGGACEGDGDADGDVDVEDLLLLLGLWGPCPPGGAPEGPENDDCADAIVIGDGLTAFSTLLATTDGNAHSPDCDTGSDGGQTYHDIWYNYTATCTGTLLVTTCQDLGGSSDYDTDIVVYGGTDCNSLSFLACNDDDSGNPCGTASPWQSTVEVAVTSGQELTIRIGGWNSGSSGTGEVLIQCTPP